MPPCFPPCPSPKMFAALQTPHPRVAAPQGASEPPFALPHSAASQPELPGGGSVERLEVQLPESVNYKAGGQEPELQLWERPATARSGRNLVHARRLRANTHPCAKIHLCKHILVQRHARENACAKVHACANSSPCKAAFLCKAACICASAGTWANTLSPAGSSAGSAFSHSNGKAALCPHGAQEITQISSSILWRFGPIVFRCCFSISTQWLLSLCSRRPLGSTVPCSHSRC